MQHASLVIHTVVTIIRQKVNGRLHDKSFWLVGEHSYWEGKSVADGGVDACEQSLEDRPHFWPNHTGCSYPEIHACAQTSQLFKLLFKVRTTYVIKLEVEGQMFFAKTGLQTMQDGQMLRGPGCPTFSTAISVWYFDWIIKVTLAYVLNLEALP